MKIMQLESPKSKKKQFKGFPQASKITGVQNSGFIKVNNHQSSLNPQQQQQFAQQQQQILGLIKNRSNTQESKKRIYKIQNSSKLFSGDISFQIPNGGITKLSQDLKLEEMMSSDYISPQEVDKPEGLQGTGVIQEQMPLENSSIKQHHQNDNDNNQSEEIKIQNVQFIKDEEHEEDRVQEKILEDILNQPKEQKQEINEIIVKMEMKKFQNLIENKLNKRNNLTHQDPSRLFPLNKIVDGTAHFVKLPLPQEMMLKSNPKLSKAYERKMLKQQQIELLSESLGTSVPVSTQNKTLEQNEKLKETLPSKMWFNKMVDDQTRYPFQIRIDTQNSYPRRTYQHSRHTSAIGSTRADIKTKVRIRSVNQSAHYQPQPIHFQEAQTIADQDGTFITSQQNKVFVFENNLQLNNQTLTTKNQSFKAARENFFQHRRVSSEQKYHTLIPQSKNLLDHGKKNQISPSQRSISLKNVQQKKRPYYSNRLDQIKANPMFEQMFEKYKSQKSQYKTELSRILNEDYDEEKMKIEVLKKSNKLQKLIGDQNTNFQFLKEMGKEERKFIDPDHIEKMRMKSKDYGSTIQKLCYAVPTFQEKLKESMYKYMPESNKVEV